MNRLFLSGLFLISLFCSNCSNNPNTNSNKKKDILKSETIKNNDIKVESFTDLPKELDGCGCSFSLSESDYKEKKYIFVNDFDQIAYIRLNGKLVKLNFVKHDDSKKDIDYYIYTLKDLTIRIDVKSKSPYGEEASKIEGKISITGKSKKKKIVPFTGVCGC